jgi:hypothetical protein
MRRNMVKLQMHYESENEWFYASSQCIVEYNLVPGVSAGCQG